MDRTLVCRECGVSFTFTQGEQEFYQSRGLANPPSRCPKCRAARRAQQGSLAGTQVARPQAQEARTLYPATCARCGQQTQVPFQPRGDRPVYCSECFHSERPAFTPSRPSFTPSRPMVPVYADVPQEEGRRERRPSRKGERSERGDRFERPERRDTRRTRDYLYNNEDEDYDYFLER